MLERSINIPLKNKFSSFSTASPQHPSWSSADKTLLTDMYNNKNIVTVSLWNLENF